MASRRPGRLGPREGERTSPPSRPSMRSKFRLLARAALCRGGQPHGDRPADPTRADRIGARVTMLSGALTPPSPVWADCSTCTGACRGFAVDDPAPGGADPAGAAARSAGRALCAGALPRRRRSSRSARRVRLQEQSALSWRCFRSRAASALGVKGCAPSPPLKKKLDGPPDD